MKLAIKASDDCAPSLEFTRVRISLQGMSIRTIDASELPRLIKEGQTVIDVRTPAEFKALHVDGAESTPLDQLNAEEIAVHQPNKPVYILCQSGKRAWMAAQKLADAGLVHPVVVDGGTLAASEAKVPVIHGKGAISVERQVRIAAGSLVFTGTLLGLFVQTGFFAIPALIGAGLVFAGVTDTCGMGLMLSKCPWNR